MDATRRLSVQEGDGKIEFAFGEAAFEFRLVAFAQRHFEFRKLLWHRLQHGGQVIAEHDFGCADPNVLRDAAANLFRNRLKIVEEGLNEFEKLRALRAQREWTALKEGYTKELFQLDN